MSGLEPGSFNFGINCTIICATTEALFRENSPTKSEIKKTVTPRQSKRPIV